MTYRMCHSLLDLHGNCNAMLEELKLPVLTRLMHRQKFSKIIIAYWKFNFQNFVYKELVWNQILNCYFKMWHSYSYLKEKAQTRWLCLKEHFCFFKKNLISRFFLIPRICESCFFSSDTTYEYQQKDRMHRRSSFCFFLSNGMNVNSFRNMLQLGRGSLYPWDYF